MNKLEEMEEIKKTRTQKGITLVALIITIIVLLILAVVAIRAVQGDGIIAHAKNAQTEYEKAQVEEQNVLSGYELILAQETGKAWKQDKTKVTKGDIIVEVGDYVNYVSGVSGYTDTNGWRVLGEENGQILLMSTANVGTVTLSGSADYYNDVGIGKLNAAAEPYGKGEYADSTKTRSIKVEDIDRITGFVKEDYGKEQVYGYGNKVTYTLGADGDTLTYTVEGKPKLNGSVKLSEGHGVFIKPDGTNLKAGESYVADQNTYYYYRGKTYLGTTTEPYKMLFRDTADSSNVTYWLGSSFAGARTDGANFGVLRVSNGLVYYCDLWYSGYGEYGGGYGVRAVVSLKSDVELTPSGKNSWTLSLK